VVVVMEVGLDLVEVYEEEEDELYMSHFITDL
jgi:hypothetical protein